MAQVEETKPAQPTPEEVEKQQLEAARKIRRLLQVLMDERSVRGEIDNLQTQLVEKKKLAKGFREETDQIVSSPLVQKYAISA